MKQILSTFTRSGLFGGKANISGEQRTNAETDVTASDELPHAYFYNEDNIATPRNHDFAKSDRFIRAFDAYRNSPFTGSSPDHHHGRWNVHVILWAATHALKLGGNIVQLGVFEGAEAAAIADYTNFGSTSQHMYLVDTFNGVPEEQWTQGEIDAGANSAQHAYKMMGDLYAYVSNRFKDFENIHITQGKVPDILPSLDIDNIGLLMLDMNVALPERAGAEYYWDKVIPGGIVTSDDYGHSYEGAGFIGQKHSFDDFAKSKGLEVLSLPTGHGIIVKP